MAASANTHILNKHFNVGDMVYLWLKDYRQQSVQSRATKKLSRRYYGAFKILECIRKVTYCLELPKDSQIHPLFHVSLLRQALSNPEPTPLPAMAEPILAPSYLLDHRLYNKDLQVLVAWHFKEVTEATWENYTDFRARFPDFCLIDGYALQLENELAVKGRAVDTVHKPNTQDPVQGSPTNHKLERPKREIKLPAL